MSFLAGYFFLFTLLFLLGAIIFRGTARLWLYTVASYIFYSFDCPPYVLILFIITVLNYYFAKLIANSAENRKRRLYLTLSLVGSLGILSTYKYTIFFAHNVNLLFSHTGIPLVLPIPNISLPWGISFYTFHAMSYIIDVYRKKIDVTNSFLEFAFFVSFFPALIAGPIIRASEFLPQIATHKPLERTNTIVGLELILLGYFKKAVIADRLSQLVDPLFLSSGTLGGAGLWIAALAFTAQIYADFSGYTDIARGLALLVGFKLPQNFNYPYFSTSLREFWHRWHMSLSFWIRDYLYISLGGNRTGELKFLGTMFITWFCVGLWHGAATHFILWGLYYGVFLYFAHILNGTFFDRIWTMLWKPVKILITFVFIVLGWVAFRASSAHEVFSIWKKMLNFKAANFTQGLPGDLGFWLSFLLSIYLVHLFFYILEYEPEGKSLLSAIPYPIRVCSIAVMITLIVICSGATSKFIYFAF